MAHKCLKCDRWIANWRKNRVCSSCQIGEPPYIKSKVTKFRQTGKSHAQYHAIVGEDKNCPICGEEQDNVR